MGGVYTVLCMLIDCIRSIVRTLSGKGNTGRYMNNKRGSKSKLSKFRIHYEAIDQKPFEKNDLL
jgi:hypothetical protein